jgi:hypothetical protein
MRFLLFEQFNPYSGAELAKKLRIYAQASDIVTNVTEIKQKKKDFVFSIYTSLPGETDGTQMFRVEIPFSQIEQARVLTFEGSGENYKEVFSTSIEINGENDLDVILLNYLEATHLFDDNDIQALVDSAKKIQSVNDIKKITRTLTPE